MPLTDDTRLAAREIMARYPRPRSALLPMLHLVQSEDGYVSPEGVRFCADELGLTKAEVGAVATFYTMYKRRPAGEYLVSVCTNTLCDVLGGQQIYDTLSETLGVGHDETTPDGRITLEHAECLAACDYAPVVTVNYEFFDQQTTESATALVGELRAGRRPLPTRGAPLCSFKEISRQLAGFPDQRPGAVDAGPAGEPTLVGNRQAVRRGETAPAYDAPVPLDRPEEPAAAVAGAGAPPAAPAATPGERTGGPAAAAETPAERSAEAGTARYGGPPDEASSGGGEGGQGVQTSASDPASSPGSGVSHERDDAKAGSGDADAPTNDRPEIGTGHRPATGSAASGGTPGGPTRTVSSPGAGGTGSPAAGAAGSGTGVASASEVDTSGTATEPSAPTGDTGTAGSATTETEPGRPGPDGEVAQTPPADAGSGGDASGDPGAPAATIPERPRATNRGRKTRKEG